MYTTIYFPRKSYLLLYILLSLVFVSVVTSQDWPSWLSSSSSSSSSSRDFGRYGSHSRDPIGDRPPMWSSRGASVRNSTDDDDDLIRREKPNRLSYDRNHSFFVRTATPETKNCCSKSCVKKCHKKHGYRSCQCRRLRRKCYGEIAIEDFDASFGSIADCEDFKG